MNPTSLVHGPLRGGGKAAAYGGEGCNVNGVLKVKKVPGSLHIKLKSPRYDVDASLINASHQVHAYRDREGNKQNNAFFCIPFLSPSLTQIHRLWFTDSGSTVHSISGSNADLRGRLIDGWMQSPLNRKVAGECISHFSPAMH